MEYFFNPGDRIELSPATDMWARGARFGTVIEDFPTTATRPAMVRVKLDKVISPKTVRKDLVNPTGQPAGQGVSKEP